MRKSLKVIVLPLVLVAALTGCSDSGAQVDKEQTNDQLLTYQKNGQNTPRYDRSEERQVLIDVMNARAKGTAGTAFFFARGGTFDKPLFQCAAKGYTVASTTQLTSPDQRIDSSGAVVALMEPTGVFTGSSDGTFVRCVDGAGKDRITYHEGDVTLVPGAAVWSEELREILFK